MYLNRNFYSNSSLPHSRFRYFIVDCSYFFLQGSRNTQVFLLSELEGMSQDFCKPANYYNLSQQSPLTILFSLLNCLSMFHKNLMVGGGDFLGEVYERIFGLWGGLTPSPQQGKPCTNYICSRVILNFISYTKGYFKVVSRW